MNLLEVTSKKNINIAGSLKELDPSQEILSYFKSEENFFQALLEMRKPTLLLKYSSNGSAHFRNFYISQSYDRVCWVSPKKLRAEVNLKDIVKFVKGRQTEKFKKNKKLEEEYDNISFSLVYLVNASSQNKTKFETDSVDLTCKDSKEFDIWFNGLKACTYAIKHNYDITSLESHMLAVESEIITMNFKSASDLKKENTEQKSVYFWGLNNYLQCGDSSDEDQVLEPKELTQVNKNEDPISLALGYSHSLMLLANGDVYAFGCALNGRLGLEDYDAQTSSENSFLPTKLSIYSMKIKSISCGDFHSAAIDEFGSYYAWGSNYEGQLGVNYYQDRFTPEKVLQSYENELKSAKIIYVRCGPRFTGIINRDNNLYMSGKNKFGVLGLDINRQTYTQFEKVKQINNVGAIACGGYHVLAIDKEKKNLFSWGWNQMGQLGSGSSEKGENPDDLSIKKVFSLKNDENNSEILQIEAGMVHSALLIREQNTTVLYTWGGNNNGQLGNGSTENSNIPKLVENLSEEDIIQISCGMFHMGAVTRNGQLLMWGDGNNGVLGNGTTSGSKIPLESKNGDLAVNRVTFVICGGSHTGIILQKSLEAKRLATECKKCKVKLDTIFKRKGHCRNCGDLFCTNCSSKKIPIIKLGYIEPVKVCDLCYENLNKFK